MIRRPPRSTLDRSSAASDVYKRQGRHGGGRLRAVDFAQPGTELVAGIELAQGIGVASVSYTHLRAHETVLDLVCRLLLEKKQSDAEHLARTD